MKNIAGLLSNKRILVVDDDEISRIVAAEILGNLGALVDLAALPDEAMVQAGTHPYDLIILDLHMPGMNGIELAAALTEFSGSLQEKIAILTASDADDPLHEAMRQSIWRHFTKPLESGQILEFFAQDTEISRTRPTEARQDLHGIDISAGISNFMGHEQSFFLTLKAFPGYGRKFIQEYEDNIEQANIKECHRLAHSLKGSSAMIGATEIHALARQLEAICCDAAKTAQIAPTFQLIKEQILKTSDSICVSRALREDLTPATLE